MLGKILCDLGFHDDKTIAYGYPSHSKKWVTIYQCRRCTKKQRVWDDLFADPRPDNIPLYEDYLITVDENE